MTAIALAKLWKEAYEMMLEEWRMGDVSMGECPSSCKPRRVVRSIREIGEQLYKSRLAQERILRAEEEDERHG